MVFAKRSLAIVVLACISLNILDAQPGDLIIPAGAKLEKVAGDCKFTEGPAADADGNRAGWSGCHPSCLLWYGSTANRSGTVRGAGERAG